MAKSLSWMNPKFSLIGLGNILLRDEGVGVHAVDLKKEPRTIANIEDEDLPSFLAPKLSLHHVGLSGLLFASSFMGAKPSQITLIGIQSEKIEIGFTLSDRLIENFEKFLNTMHVRFAPLVLLKSIKGMSWKLLQWR